MSLEIFDEIFSGNEVNLFQMLDARDKRYNTQLELLEKYPKATLLVVTMNIPGNVKNSSIISEVFNDAIREIDSALPLNSVLFKQYTHVDTGNEGFYVIDLPANEVKNKMVHIEEDFIQGRLYDLDVLTLSQEGSLVKFSREDSEKAPRKCFVCNRNAKECARSRAHSDLEMKRAVARLIMSKYGEE